MADTNTNMTVATTRDYWISPNALHIERNAMSNPDYIQASCVSGAQILVYIKDVISYDAGHNYRRWLLQASPTVFNTHTEKYVYVAVPRDSVTSTAMVVFPSELLDIYGKNEKQEQIGSENYYYIFLQGILSSSGDNGTEPRDWLLGHTVHTGYLSSDEAINAGPNESEWFLYDAVNEIVIFLKDLTVKAGQKFRELFVKAVTIVTDGYITFEGQEGELKGIANADTPVDSEETIVTPKYMDDKALSSVHDDIAQGIIRFMQGLKLGDGEKGVDADGNAVLSDVVVDRVHDAKSTPAERVVVGAQGFDMYMGEDGKSHLYVDYLTTRVKMFAASAEVRKVSYSGGTTIFSNAGSTIVKVAYIFDASGSTVIAYKCYAAADDGTTRTMNWWHVGMMALCQTFNVKPQTEGEFANRYYWRLVVGVGQEVLADGKLYDYVILSNVKDFYGSDGVPCYGIKLLADGQNNVLSWGGVAVSVVSDNGMSSFASVFNDIEGGTQDDGGNKIVSRKFYGYEPDEGGGEPDAPAPNDVIVQVGDQVRWKKYGNLIKLTTSTEDNATDNAPAIAMYHGMGAPYVDKKSGNTNPYQWKTLTSIDSPELVKKNAKNFMFFTNDDPDDVVSPISTTYEIIASSDTLVRNPMTQTVTPADITFSTIKRYGSKTETLTTVLYRAKYTTQDDVTHEGHFVSALSELEVNLYDIKEITVFAYDSINTVLTSRTIAVLTDGEKGEKGDTGEKGKDTISLVAEPSSLTFGTDDNGKARGQAVVQVKFYEGSSIKNFLNTPVFKTENFEDGYTPTRQGEEIVIIDASKLKAQKIVDTADGTERYVSCTSASVTITDTLNGKQYQVKIPIFVDVESYISRMEMTAKQYKQTFEELKSDLGEENPDILTQYTSTIKQTAREISLKVSQTAVGRKNLLVGSALRRQREGVELQTQEGGGIETLNGVAGVNCAHVIATAPTCYIGLFWWGINPYITKCIKIEKNKTYTASCWVKCDRTDVNVCIEARWAETATGGERLDNVIQSGGNVFAVKQANEWQLCYVTFNTNDTEKFKDFIECNFVVNNRTEGVTTNAWICQPMLVEGEDCIGWSMSSEDFDYIGGNLLDNTDTLVAGGNLTVVDGSYSALHPRDNSDDEINRQSYKGFPTLNTDIRFATDVNYIDMLVWRLGSDVVKQDQDYMFSFMAKGNKGGQFIAYFYGANSTEKVFVEVLDRVNGPNQYTMVDGNAQVEFKEDYVWKRYWVHWRVVGDTLPSKVMIRCNKGTDMYVSQPKLEYGATVTEYRATKTDFVEDKSVAGKLLDAGIDVDSKEITLTADKTKFRTRSGRKVAVFDENGLNADLINAKHVWAKSENGNSTVGHFGNYEPDFCKVSDNVYAPLFVGSSTAANAPFYVDSTGAIKATAGEIANFVITSSGLRSGIKGTTDYLYLGDFQVAFVSRDGHDKVRLGSSVLPPSSGYAQSGLYIESTHDFENYESIQVNIGSYIEVGGKQYLPAVRTLPDDDETQYINGNHALYIQKGDVVGLRPMLTVATKSRNILKRECVIVCLPPLNTTIILTLPDDPEVGQHYTFITKTGHWNNGANGGTVRILSREGKGKSIFRFTAENSWYFDIWHIYTVAEMWFDGDNWIMQFYTQN